VRLLLPTAEKDSSCNRNAPGVTILRLKFTWSIARDQEARDQEG
jgi:hypothetical protein